MLSFVRSLPEKTEYKMDNQFENDFNNAQPQRPFNEKPEPPVNAEQAPSFDFQPEKPLMQNPAPGDTQQFIPQPRQAPENINPAVQAPVPEAGKQFQDGFNPIEHTATYADNRFVNRQYPPQPMPQQMPPQMPPQMPQQPMPPQPFGYQAQQEAPTDYGEVRRYERATPPRPNYGYGYQPQTQVYNGGYAQQIQPNQPEPPKSKANKGLVFVIIVLSVLLAASIGGIIFFTFKDADSSGNSKKNNSEIEFTIPNNKDFTLPNADDNKTVEEKHSESDYSDKVDKNFKGISLENLPSDKSNSKYDSEYAYSKVSDSVVGIECYLDDETTAESQGSGTIITSDGYVLTNAHVFGNSKKLYSIKVVDANNKKYNAGVVGFDTRTDLAILKMDDAKDLKAVTFGDSDNLKIGENIFIVGNPGGIEFKNSLTKGIVSALNRDASNKSIVKYIQTDAAINPGNSGGPAVNVYGQVVGIASSKIVDEKYEGMAFCIPSTTVKSIADSLMKYGYVQGRVKIGISGYAVSSAAASQYDVPTGILAETVSQDGPCGKAGVKAGEIVTEFDGTKISSFSDIYNKLEEHKDGDKVKIKVYNTDSKKEREVEITLQEDK